MANIDFSALEKQSSESFHAQKRLIKQLGRGKTVLCPECSGPLSLRVPGEKTISNYGVKCQKGCTDIELEFEDE
ncbi:hypothetical protein [Paraferrimonas sp. SM1919]|uniref:hypothetical protein n=1 Tax=Paraferrimonas sp. SM1919 TaxID=2662263 RepID=UPI0013D0B962|nr:hypothetical protein [Paraferrimonas sp. SM1919]